MTAFYAPDPIQSTQLIPGGNTPAAGAQLFCYLPGTSVKQNTYTDQTASTARTNPIVLDSGGNIPGNGEVWIASTAKFVLAPSNDGDPPLSPYWTRDNLPGLNNVSALVASSATGEWVQGSTATFVGVTQFSLVGDQTLLYTTGRRIKAAVTGGDRFGIVTSQTLASGTTTVGVLLDSGTLNGGLSNVQYGVLSTPNGSMPWTQIGTSGVFLIASGVSTVAFLATSATVSSYSGVIGTYSSTFTVQNLVDLSASSAGRINFTSTNPSTSGTILDDYREISWTPGILFGGTSTGVTFSARTGTATKIGNRVLAEYDITFSALGSASGAASLINLPGPPSTSNLTPVGIIDWINMGIALVSMDLVVNGSTGLFRGLSAASTNVQTLTSGSFSSTANVRGSVSYFV